MPSTWKLIIEDDAGKQIVVPFTRDVITIGRKEGNTIRLTERNVSRNHAKLSKENGHVLIEDLKSFNGIKLNGDRIDGRVHVHEGDTIQIGDYHLALHAQDTLGVTAPQHPHNGAAEGAQATQPLHRDTAPHGPDDDEFAGDTQRWEPPQGGPALSVPGLATQEDHPLSDERTVPSPAVAGAQPAPQPAPENGSNARSGFDPDGGDTERVTMEMLEAMEAPTVDAAALPSRQREAELEPTVRQATSPPPITMPPAPPPAAHKAVAHKAEGSPTAAVPEIGGHVGVLETKPEPRAQDRAPDARPATPSPDNGRAPGTPAAPARPNDARTALEEQTEAMRAAPGAEDVVYPRLVVLNTIFAGSTFSLRAAEAVLGRTEDNDITIEHKSVSRNHAKVVREGDRVRILDLKSANGVLVNNEEVEQAVLKPGDVVELGRVRLRFVAIGERFAVSPEEIERARIADTAGDDFEQDAGTGVTNPVRKKQADAVSAAPFEGFSQPSGRPNIIVIGVVVVIALLAVIAVLVATSGGDDKPTPPPPTAAASPTPTTPDTAPVPDGSGAKPDVGPTGDDAPAAAAAAAGADDAAAHDDAAPGDAHDDGAAAGADDDAALAAADDAAGDSGGHAVRAEPKHKRKTDEPRVTHHNKQAEINKALSSATQKIFAGDPGAAVSELAPYVNGNNANVHRTLGVAYAKLKKNDLARKHYRKYLELKPDAEDASKVRAILKGQ